MDLEKKIIHESETYARQRMSRLHSSHGWDHVDRVIRMADRISLAEETSDHFIVHMAAVLHDIARINETDSNGELCHARLGSEMAYDFLRLQGLDHERSLHISRCILTHRFRNSLQPETIEAKIVYDADKLDSIGAIGIGRAFLFSGEVGARLHNPDIDINLTEAYSKEDTAYREFMVKLRFISGKMLTREGKRLADERHEFMETFFHRIREEANGNL